MIGCHAAAQDFGLSKIVEEGHSRGLELTSQGFAEGFSCPAAGAGLWAEQDRGGGAFARAGADQPGFFVEGFACPGAAQDFGLSKIVEEGHSRGLELTSEGFAERFSCPAAGAGLWAEQDRGGGAFARAGADQRGFC